MADIRNFQYQAENEHFNVRYKNNENINDEMKLCKNIIVIVLPFTKYKYKIDIH